MAERALDIAVTRHLDRLIDELMAAIEAYLTGDRKAIRRVKTALDALVEGIDE